MLKLKQNQYLKKNIICRNKEEIARNRKKNIIENKINNLKNLIAIFFKKNNNYKK